MGEKRHLLRRSDSDGQRVGYKGYEEHETVPKVRLLEKGETENANTFKAKEELFKVIMDIQISLAKEGMLSSEINKKIIESLHRIAKQ